MRPTNDNDNEWLHRKARLILRQHAEISKEIAWLLRRRIELENKLDEIDEQLGLAPRESSPVLRLDSRHTGPN
jgi:hypothetical protein